MKISGAFEVSLEPIECSLSGDEGHMFGRMTIEKKYSGKLTAIGSGEMLSLRTAAGGSAGYVALEFVKGTLDGKEGSFVLQHYGAMSQGEQFLMLAVVPDSGTGDLAGLSGKMSIRIEDGSHFYDFEYEI